MSIRTLLIIMLISINITACSSMGNVVPKTGPSMEQVYDGMNQPTFTLPNNMVWNTSNQTPPLTSVNLENTAAKNPSADTVSQDFKEIPNLELSVYIYPHLAEEENLPIPGYWTQFNVYKKDYYQPSF